MTRRLAQLLIGLWLFGISLAMVIRSGLGNASWDVLHQGLANHLPITIGQAVILMSLLVLLVWIPLREIPGVGTLLNAVVVGYSIDVSLGWLSTPRDLWLRWCCCWWGLCSMAWRLVSISERALALDLVMA
ncbi:MAG: hypothetical protein R2709_15940 [Marmoricola sp.]